MLRCFKKLTQPNDMTAKNEAIHYIKDRYAEDQSRFESIESKCEKLMGLLTISIAALGASFRLNSEKLLNPTDTFDWFITGIGLLSFFLLACSWGHALLALKKIRDWPKAPISRESCEYLLECDYEETLQHIFNCYVDTMEGTKKILEEKFKNLEKSYNQLGLSAISLAAFFTLIVIKEFIL